MNLKTTVKKGSQYWVVSTVRLQEALLPIDKALSIFKPGLGAPGPYETMVFRGDKEGNITDWTDREMARYPSAQAAKTGHAKMVRRWGTPVAN